MELFYCMSPQHTAHSPQCGRRKDWLKAEEIIRIVNVYTVYTQPRYHLEITATSSAPTAGTSTSRVRIGNSVTASPAR